MVEPWEDGEEWVRATKKVKEDELRPRSMRQGSWKRNVFLVVIVALGKYCDIL